MASDLSHPRSLFTLPNGDVLAIESQGPGSEPIKRPNDLIMGSLQSLATSGRGGEKKPTNQITLLRDADGDGVPETGTVFLDHLNSRFGVALVGNDFYVAKTDAIVRYPYTPGATKITEPGVVPTPPARWSHRSSLDEKPGRQPRRHTALCRGRLDQQHHREWHPGGKDRAAIWEVDRATGRSRIFASGLRSPNGLTWEPKTGALWAVVNERDELGPNLVPDSMTSVKDGAFYGWPYSYYGQHVDPRVMPHRPDLVAKAIPPDYALSSHVAPLGLTFTGTALPQIHQGGAFVGEHGSWDRPALNGYKVVFVPFGDGHPDGMAQDFVTGFLNAKEKPVPAGRAGRRQSRRAAGRGRRR